MICKCGTGEAMQLVAVFDTASNGGSDGKDRAHNVYMCERCGMVAVDRVWDDAGVTWVKADGSVETVEKS